MSEQHLRKSNDSYGSIVITIPAYQPESPLLAVVAGLKERGFSRFLIVNDGSSEPSQKIFDALRPMPGVRVIDMPVNRGKGEALKTAFRELAKTENFRGVITCDADGQHLPEDIAKVADAFLKNPTQLYLGSRQFHELKVPLRSKFGNVLTKFIFRGLVGKKLADTQTGLRAIPAFFLAPLLELKTSRYEFELEMLIHAHKNYLPLQEVPITTVYANNNESSHFNPTIDSVKIYFVFFRFLLASGLSAIIDTSVFFVAQYLSHNLFFSMGLARLTAGMVNFTLGRTLIFKSDGPLLWELAKYWALVGCYLFIAYSVIHMMVEVAHINIYVAKLSTEGVVFLFSFLIQRAYVFNSTQRAIKEQRLSQPIELQEA